MVPATLAFCSAAVPDCTLEAKGAVLGSGSGKEQVGVELSDAVYKFYVEAVTASVRAGLDALVDLDCTIALVARPGIEKGQCALSVTTSAAVIDTVGTGVRGVDWQQQHQLAARCSARLANKPDRDPGSFVSLLQGILDEPVGSSRDW
jgi:hypothetical protein